MRNYNASPQKVVAVAFERRAFTRRSNYRALTEKKCGVLDRWSRMGSGRLREVVVHGDSTINAQEIGRRSSTYQRSQKPESTVSETNIQRVDEEHQEKATQCQGMCIVRNSKLIGENERYRACTPHNGKKYGQLLRRKEK